MDSGIFLNGQQVELFEEAWARYCKADYCLACASGTDALTIAALGCKMGRAIIPANTLSFTKIGLSRAGCGILYADVDPTFGLPLYDYRGMVTPVLLYGRYFVQAGPMPDIIDACQAHGCKQCAWAMCWSFFPTKNLGCFGDGGAVTTNDEKILKRMREYPVFHSRMSEINAAVLRVKLPYLDFWNAMRQEIAEVYYENLPGFVRPAVSPNMPSNHHIFAILIDERRDELKEYLIRNEVGCKVHYPDPLDLKPGAIQWCNSILSLPCYPGLSLLEVRKICDLIKGFK